MGAADGVRIVDAGLGKPGYVTKLSRALFGHHLHFVLGAEMQAPGRTRLDTSRLETSAHAVRAQRALINLLGCRIELGNIERAAGYAELATDAVLLLEVDDSVCILHDRAVGGT